jgi:hypothetical protein
VLGGRVALRRNLVRQTLALMTLATLPVANPLAAEEQLPTKAALESAQALFKVYADEEGKFDPAVADLYADDAIIKNRRVYPDGRAREMSLPAPQYKEMVRAAMPAAKQRGDTNKYTGCKYTAQAERIRISCTRYSNLKQYESPLSLLVGPGKDGRWLILEELSESRP